MEEAQLRSQLLDMMTDDDGMQVRLRASDMYFAGATADVESREFESFVKVCANRSWKFLQMRKSCFTFVKRSRSDEATKCLIDIARDTAWETQADCLEELQVRGRVADIVKIARDDKIHSVNRERVIGWIEDWNSDIARTLANRNTDFGVFAELYFYEKGLIKLIRDEDQA
jgi:hypothetical protein